MCQTAVSLYMLVVLMSMVGSTTGSELKEVAQSIKFLKEAFLDSTASSSFILNKTSTLLDQIPVLLHQIQENTDRSISELQEKLEIALSHKCLSTSQVEEIVASRMQNLSVVAPPTVFISPTYDYFLMLLFIVLMVHVYFSRL
eukprot:TRINITY_DN9919_c0_g1_i2.p1 TRINITY_DN9919_c0_g1~~TRINITY_DN9919_c0_g1_i2.p1  ORF type:complete len:143 (+),score=14.27 TRINITY_DN9919_c0_g1_i2:99-527(+)